jgi:hypothetical protein
VLQANSQKRNDADRPLDEQSVRVHSNERLARTVITMRVEATEPLRPKSVSRKSSLAPSDRRPGLVLG